MAKYVIDGSNLTGIAGQIRRLKENDELFLRPQDMCEHLKTIKRPQESYDEGHEAGHEAGYEAGYEEGFIDGNEEGEALGFDQGAMVMYDLWWDAFQNNGERVHYDYAFYRLKDTSAFFPKYDMTPTTIAKMFQYFGNEADPLDIAERFENAGIKFDTSAATAMTAAFYWTGGIKRIPEISTVKADSLYTFCHNCSNLETIDKIILKNDGSQSLDVAFGNCPKLKNITFEGVIGYNTVSFSSSPLLTHDSLMSIINALKDNSEDTSGTAWIVSIGSSNKAKLTAEELQIANDKGWTVY